MGDDNGMTDRKKLVFAMFHIYGVRGDYIIMKDNFNSSNNLGRGRFRIDITSVYNFAAFMREFNAFMYNSPCGKAGDLQFMSFYGVISKPTLHNYLTMQSVFTLAGHQHNKKAGIFVKSYRGAIPR